MGEKKGTAVDAEGSGGPIQQVAVGFCGPQLDPAGYGRPAALRCCLPAERGAGTRGEPLLSAAGCPRFRLDLQHCGVS